jgi:hypothetical protein
MLVPTSSCENCRAFCIPSQIQLLHTRSPCTCHIIPSSGLFTHNAVGLGSGLVSISVGVGRNGAGVHEGGTDQQLGAGHVPVGDTDESQSHHAQRGCHKGNVLLYMQQKKRSQKGSVIHKSTKSQHRLLKAQVPEDQGRNFHYLTKHFPLGSGLSIFDQSF